jgi:hypothetical protein
MQCPEQVRHLTAAERRGELSCQFGCVTKVIGERMPPLTAISRAVRPQRIRIRHRQP